MSDRIHSLSGYMYEYQKSVQDPESFWSRIADSFHWRKKWDKVVDWNFETPDVKWFVNGKLNITENILDRHLYTRGDQAAIIWEPNDPEEEHITLTYKELHAKVCQFANAIKAKGVCKGDRVIIYMPMVPEAAIAMLACARIGAIHSIVFAGFSANALSDRINDCKAKMVITSDGNFRGSKQIPVKEVVDEALKNCDSVESTIVLKRTGQDIQMTSGHDIWWHDVIEGVSSENKAEEMDSEDILFILYTSGSTGQPKGVVHTCGGYMIYTAYSFQNVFQYNQGDVYWCTADVGWITGHSYIVYGPLLAGATSIIFEGVPTFPDAGRFWAICDKHQVNQFYTAPTAIRALQAYGTEPIEPYKLDSLKVLGSVGEPINEEAWHWYHDHVGKGKCPIVDTWWQTETGGIMVSPLAGITPTKPAYATLPLPGVQLVILDNEGNELKGNSVEGNLCIKFPWPSMLRTTYGDHDRCKQTYFSTFPNHYFTGDGVKRDEDGYYRILGRVDDVINVSGHRMGTAEVENAINEHPKVVESAVVGYPHDIKGQGIYAFVICDMDGRTEEGLIKEIKETVTKIIGPIARPDKLQIVPGLPKTRSGKIMRRILRKIASGEGDNLGDISTLFNPEVVEAIKEGANR
ncbi:acetyl-coenzyme A synthetase [Roseivirga ehrenbergii]|uniref:Acetate--CoA ligase n=1 Tax=Roseivirga ehrenbergii (strain DSM 102268 / JCM 13514 / KCTC 12282 / NCIMB 14502 / KMM 6017) TaxID=279360 RepID=A0A150XN10_ROSEK|nr:acetate--CoA ligase [Roseivirga ehrenbergii]KYG80136.1 acetyl-coenzyme A synthetase [Roseivirga ehrenbergii]TCK99165.1 acetyl-coenzyme A synthetase [Roseivirga ehrenbergii]